MIAASVRHNIAALFTLQAANYLLPLITLPYLVRVLGVEHYGRIAFAQAFIQYFAMLADYGFNLSATRSVAVLREDVEALSRLVSAVMLVKLFLMLTGFVAMLGIVLLVPVFNRDWPLYVLVYLTVVGNALFPAWLFQGLERMRQITVLIVLARLLMVVAIFVLVRREQDYHLAAALQAGGMVLAGVGALLTLPRLVVLRWHWPGWHELHKVVADGWHVFLSTAGINLYTSSNVFILGLLTNHSVVGYYSAAEKLVKAALGLIDPVSQAVYPHIATLASRSRDAALAFIARLLRLQSLVALALSLLLYFMAEPLVGVLFGARFEPSVRVIEWLAALPFAIGLSNVFGIQTMLNFDMKLAFNRIIIASGLINLVLIIPLAYWHGAVGAAISVLITEYSVTMLMAMHLARHGYLQRITCPTT